MADVNNDGQSHRVLLDAADVSRTIARVAHQVIEKTALDAPGAPHVVLIGIPTRGTSLAKRLGAKISEFAGTDIPVGYLDITLYRDDLRDKPHRPLERTMVPAGGVDGAIVILVDDVLYSGRTVRAALDALR
ncbi:MAG TPA: phosphoribosyltransferase family protein, partial [Gordonia sp. (in: high G+C Gram-positive bacteria)]|nr:phosphoribosyltransferase family protein [Gordonia sp. (in: high G+C Gram-positive bacteria)]